MTGNTSPAEISRLRPATTVALAVLLLAWTGWKLYKLEAFWGYGFFSWQFLGATLLGAGVFLVCLMGIFWAFEPTPPDEP